MKRSKKQCTPKRASGEGFEIGNNDRGEKRNGKRVKKAKKKKMQEEEIFISFQESLLICHTQAGRASTQTNIFLLQFSIFK
jgi:hypothetical protein